MTGAPCNCDEVLALRAELEHARVELAYLRGMALPEDLRVMRQELAAGWRPDGWLPDAEQTDVDAVF